MNKKLLDFHLSCKEELSTLLKTFNLLFYGYGNKENILSLIFPDAIQFNMRFCTVESIVEDIQTEFKLKRKAKTLERLESLLINDKKTITCILYNFDLTSTAFTGLKAIKIIGTIENIHFQYTQDNLIDYNFILRDLTTFENYTEDILYYEAFNNKIQNVKLVLGNLSEKPKFAFKELLKIGNCSFTKLFDNIKSTLFLSKILSLKDLLREFIDHKIIKVSGNNITINLTLVERESVLQFIEDVDLAIHK